MLPIGLIIENLNIKRDKEMNKIIPINTNKYKPLSGSFAKE